MKPTLPFMDEQMPVADLGECASVPDLFEGYGKVKNACGLLGENGGPAPEDLREGEDPVARLWHPHRYQFKAKQWRC